MESLNNQDLGQPGGASDAAADGAVAEAWDNASEPIGIVLEIAGSGSAIALDLQRLQECAEDQDPSVVLAGQVGSQIKIRVGRTWLLASVRTQRQDPKASGRIMAQIDFLGEGDEERLAEGMGKITVDSPIPYLLSDLTSLILAEMGKLDKSTSSAPYMRIKNKIDELRADPRFQFMFSGMLVGDTMAEFISKIFRLPSRGKPISIIDVSGVPSDITATVVAVLSRMVFDFAIWARDEKTRPVLLVCEEAHRYVPSERDADGSSVGKILGRIAKEGRKYGVSLGLITQRPSDLAEGVFSQCGTIIAMRLNNDRDQAFVKAAMPEGARGFLDAIPALRNREAIICGEGVTIPIRVAFDELEEAKRPASADPLVSELWCQSGGEEEMVHRTVQRWRAQGR